MKYGSGRKIRPLGIIRDNNGREEIVNQDILKEENNGVEEIDQN